jgi:hypothetical protein
LWKNIQAQKFGCNLSPARTKNLFVGSLKASMAHLIFSKLLHRGVYVRPATTVLTRKTRVFEDGRRPRTSHTARAAQNKGLWHFFQFVEPLFEFLERDVDAFGDVATLKFLAGAHIHDGRIFTQRGFFLKVEKPKGR